MARKSLASEAVLAETRERLLRVSANDKALWGRMSATEMIRHLGCSCEVALGERAVGPMRGIPPAVLKFLALRSGMRWAKNMSTTPELKEAILTPSSVEFDELVRVAIEKTEAVARGGGYAPAHPMFGAMAPEDWMRWGYLHTDHHLRQFGR